jgi:rubrerythrin
MQLNSFGSILGFAADMETKDEAFYSSAAGAAEARIKSIFEQFVTDGKKNLKNVQRTRRENVTEMILEGISDFTSEAFEFEPGSPDDMDAAALLEVAAKMEARAERFYLEAAEKIRALPEVTRALKLVAKKRTAHIKLLSEI